jgi:hypothetical protein
MTPVIKDMSDCLNEVLEFLPDAYIESGREQIVAPGGAIWFIPPMEIGPRKEISQWRCDYILNFHAYSENGFGFPISQLYKFKIERDFGATAPISFIRMKNKLAETIDGMQNSFNELNKIELARFSNDENQ